MRALALLVVITLVAGSAPAAWACGRGARAAAKHTCCCPHAERTAPAQPGPRISRRCGCEAKQAPADAPPNEPADATGRAGSAPVALVADAPLALPRPRADRGGCELRPRPPPRLGSLFQQRSSLLL